MIITAIDGGMASGGVVSMLDSGDGCWDVVHPPKGATIEQAAQQYAGCVAQHKAQLGQDIALIVVESFTWMGHKKTRHDVGQLAYCIIGTLAGRAEIVKPVPPAEWREHICCNRSASHERIEQEARLRFPGLCKVLDTGLTRKDERSHVYDAALMLDYGRLNLRAWRMLNG